MRSRLRQLIRRNIKAVRANLTDEFIYTNSALIYKNLRHLDLYRYAKKIALYFAVNGEVSMQSVWKAAPMQGKQCFLPSLSDDEKLLFLPATPNTPMKKNRYGILEPDVCLQKAHSIKELDLILMPLVAFDALGNRIGMGKGYYDKTLASLLAYKETHLLGVAFEFQKVSTILPEPWDVPMDGVVTEKTVYWRK